MIPGGKLNFPAGVGKVRLISQLKTGRNRFHCYQNPKKCKTLAKLGKTALPLFGQGFFSLGYPLIPVFPLYGSAGYFALMIGLD